MELYVLYTTVTEIKPKVRHSIPGQNPPGTPESIELFNIIKDKRLWCQKQPKPYSTVPLPQK